MKASSSNSERPSSDSYEEKESAIEAIAKTTSARRRNMFLGMHRSRHGS